eukprot:7874187-Pyramimonas_sp.AAC.1
MPLGATSPWSTRRTPAPRGRCNASGSAQGPGPRRSCRSGPRAATATRCWCTTPQPAASP